MAKTPCGIVFEGKKYTPEEFMHRLMADDMRASVYPEKGKQGAASIERQKKVNALLDKVDEFNQMSDGPRGKGSSEGARLKQEIQNQAKELGYNYDRRGRYVTVTTKQGNKPRRSFAFEGNKSKAEGYVPLNERPKEVQETFAALKDLGVYSFPDVKGADGKRLSPKQIESAVADVLNGNETVAADNLLKSIQESIADGVFEFKDKASGEVVRVPAEEYLSYLKDRNKEVAAKEEAISEEEAQRITDEYWDSLTEEQKTQYYEEYNREQQEAPNEMAIEEEVGGGQYEGVSEEVYTEAERAEGDKFIKEKVEAPRGFDKAAEGLDELATSLGFIKKAAGEERPDAAKALQKIAEGLLEEGASNSKDIFRKVVEYVREKFPNVDLRGLKTYQAELETFAKNYEERGLLKTVKDSPQTTAEMKAKVEELNQFYEVVSNKDSLSKADREIKKDLTAAKEAVLSDSAPTAEKSAMAVRLIKHFEKAGDYDQAIEVLDSYDKQLRAAGQFTQAASMWNKLAPETVARKAKRSAEKLGIDLDPEVQKEILKRMSEVDLMPEGVDKDKATMEVLNYIADQMPLTKMELLDAYRYQNMLSNPKSHLRNIYGNLFNAFITEPATIGVKAGYDLFKDPYNPAARDAKFSDIPRYYKDIVNNMPNAFIAAGEAFRNGYVADKILDLKSTEDMIEQLRKTKLPKYLTVSMRFLEAQDRFFSVLISQGEKARLMRNGVGEVEANRRATELATEYLYREKLESKSEQNLATIRALDALGESLNAIRSKPYLGKAFGWFVPFVTTPINVAKLSIKYSPIAAAEMGVGAMRGKNYTREQISKATVGSIITGIGAVYALQGLTTWALPSDKKERELFYASGRKPFSIKVGDKWVPMAYLGPFALAFALPTAYKHFKEYDKNAASETELEAVKNAALSVSGFITSQTPLTGVEGFLNAVSGQGDASMIKQLGYTSTQLIPASGLLRYVNTIMDPVYRKSKGYLESIESGIPGMSEELEAYKGPKGEESRRAPVNYVLPFDLGISDEEYELQLKDRRERVQKLAKIRKERGGGRKAD